MAFRCFNNGKPKLNASDKIYNTKVKTIYNHNKTQFLNGNLSNYGHTICYDSSTNAVKKVNTFDMYLALNYGLSLCDDCSGESIQSPLPDTEYGPNTRLTMSTGNLADISCNAMIDISCNLDFTYDSAGALAGWVVPAPGMTSIIDPSNIIIGDYTDCEQKKYLDLVTMHNMNLTGNDTQDNYLQHLQHPRKIKLN